MRGLWRSIDPLRNVGTVGLHGGMDPSWGHGDAPRLVRRSTNVLRHRVGALVDLARACAFEPAIWDLDVADARNGVYCAKTVEGRLAEICG